MTHSSTPKVSVCIPVYNGSNYIAESIESVLAQTYEDYQLIVIDNCSTDNTEEIVRNFDDPRLTYIRNKQNLGLMVNFNRCLELATGEYVYIWHHDDVMLPDNLKLKVQLLDEHPDVGFVHSNLINIDDKGAVVASEIWYEGSRHDYIEDGLTAFNKYLAHMPRGASLFIGAVLARRSCYEKVGEFCVELPHCLDSEMWMRMMLFYKVACIGTPLLKYRIHPTTASKDLGDWDTVPYIKEHYEVTQIIFKRYYEHIPNAEKLIEQNSRNFGKRAIYLANLQMLNDDFSAARDFIKEAVFFNPEIKKTKAFWKTKLKLVAGPKANKFYRKFCT